MKFKELLDVISLDVNDFCLKFCTCLNPCVREGTLHGDWRGFIGFLWLPSLVAAFLPFLPEVL